MSTRRPPRTILALLLLVGSGCTERTTHSKEDRRLLERFRTDPVASYRAPGTELQSSQDILGGTKRPLLGGPEYTSSEYSQTLSIGGDAGATVESYLKPAAAAGWRLVKIDCSRQKLSVQAVFTTLPEGLSQVVPEGEPNSGSIRPAEVLTVTAAADTRSLRVRFVRDSQPATPAAASLGLPRRDVHCLRGFDPADPRRQPRSVTPARTADQLCALALTTPLRENVIGTPRPLEAIGLTPQCQFDFAGAPFAVTVSDAAQRSRAMFEDLQYSAKYADDRFFLIVEDAVGSPEKLGGAWVDTPGGPIEVRMLDVADDTVANFGRALQKAASMPPNAPGAITATTTTAPPTASRTPVTSAPSRDGRCTQSLVPDPDCNVGPVVTGRPR